MSGTFLTHYHMYNWCILKPWYISLVNLPANSPKLINRRSIIRSTVFSVALSANFANKKNIKEKRNNKLVIPKKPIKKSKIDIDFHMNAIHFKI